MTERDLSARGLISEIAEEFQRLGWRDHGGLALKIVQQAQERGALDTDDAASLAGRGFLVLNRTSRARVREVLDGVFAGRSLLDPSSEHSPTMSETHNTHTNINIGDANTLSDVHINVGGQQLNLTAQATKPEVLAGLTGLLRQAIETGLDGPKLARLDQLVSAREDVDQSEIEAVVAEVIEETDPASSTLVKLRDGVMTSTASGLVVHGIIAAIGALGIL